MVAPWLVGAEVGAEVVAVVFEVAEVEGRPRGFATVAPWEAAGVEFVAVVVAGAGLEDAGNPSGFATVAPCVAIEAAGAAAGDGVTVADITFVVTFGAPAELVVGSADVAVVAGVLTAGAAFAGVAGVAALGADATTFAGVVLEAVTLGPAEAVVEITAVELDGDVVAAGATFVSGLLVGATVTISGGAFGFCLPGDATVVATVVPAALPCVMLAADGLALAVVV
jgi:hypothetical protein